RQRSARRVSFLRGPPSDIGGVYNRPQVNHEDRPMPAVLPSELQSKLSALGGRERRLRLRRGVGRTAAVAIAAALAIMALDAWLTLSPIVRLPLVLAWVAMVVIATRRWLVAPLKGSIDPAVLAAAVEAEYPRLDERLSSSVELAAGAFDGSGSPALIDLLIRETDLK